MGANKGEGYPPATPMSCFSGRLFPQTSMIGRDSISELKPDSCSTHLMREASGDCSQIFCRLFFQLRRRSFETFSRISPRWSCQVPGGFLSNLCPVFLLQADIRDYYLKHPQGGIYWSGSIATGATWILMAPKRKRSAHQKIAPGKSKSGLGLREWWERSRVRVAQIAAQS
jgi:hypothetical protein